MLAEAISLSSVLRSGPEPMDVDANNAEAEEISSDRLVLHYGLLLKKFLLK